MARPKVLADEVRVQVRMDGAIVDRLAALAERLRRFHPGLNISRSEAVRYAIARGLDMIESEDPGPRKVPATDSPAAGSGPGKTP